MEMSVLLEDGRGEKKKKKKKEAIRLNLIVVYNA